MRLTKFNFEMESHTAALKRAVRNANHLSAVHSAQIKAAFDLAELLDDLDLGRDPETGKIVLPRLLNTYTEILSGLGLRFERGRGGLTREELDNAARSDATPAPVSKLDEYRLKIAGGGNA